MPKNGGNPTPDNERMYTIGEAATLYGVKPATIRAASKTAAAFKAPGATLDDVLKDMNGNPTGYKVTYLRKSAIDSWLVERSEKPAARERASKGGASRYYIRLTPAQAEAFPASAFAVENGNLTLENVNKPRPKRVKPEAAAPATNETETANALTDSDLPAPQMDLFADFPA